MLTKLKKQVESLLISQARLANSLGFSPNIISVFGIFFALFSGIAYVKWQQNPILPVIAPLLLLLSGYCDALDGALARLHQKTTVFGGFLDSMLDRYADVFVFGGILLGGLCEIFWGLTAIIGTLLVSYARARAEMENVKMENIGIAERAERILIIVVASFANIFWQSALNVSIILLAFLTHLTVIQRIIYFYKKLKIRNINHASKKTSSSAVYVHPAPLL